MDMMSTGRYLCVLFVRHDGTFDDVAFILLGGAVFVYALRAKTFRESKNLHMLTPAKELDEYAPKLIQRFLLAALGLAVVISSVYQLFRRYA
jgi:hypothetical protein